MGSRPIIKVLEGRPYPLGATWDGKGVNFAIYSAHAERLELCLFDSIDSIRECHKVEMKDVSHHVWHCYIEDAGPGLLYGYRVFGPYDPSRGLKFNHHKLLLDPYAKAIARSIKWHPSLFGYIYETQDPFTFDTRDSAAFAPLGIVTADNFCWGDDRSPERPLSETILYEAHVKGLTCQHPRVPKAFQGTFLGIGTDAVIEHLQQIGVTAIELLPIHAHVDEKRLDDLLLSNYWGYNTLNFFTPDARFAATSIGLTGLLPGSNWMPDIMYSGAGGLDAAGQFRTMVRKLHAAGIEIILDVVFNHTGEEGYLGPHLSFRGIDNTTYYRIEPGRHERYENFSGCGNTLNTSHPAVIQLIMDSLRYWVSEMHVDGFRFDLAVALARESQAGATVFDPGAGLLDAIGQCPVLSKVKLIAEPWDLGPYGYRVGGFPPRWSEWNGKFRDTVRAAWLSDGGMKAELATRISGSSDIFGWGGRHPQAGINFVTCHDGFTLEDMVSYVSKHNEANGEENRDGESHNFSVNFGVEGPVSEPKILKERLRHKKNLLATLFLSLGVPMLLQGDELGNSQSGNNNSYCQDNELSWLDWDCSARYDSELLPFISRLAELRTTESCLKSRVFLKGDIAGEHGCKDLGWFNEKGNEMTPADWHNPLLKVFSAMYNTGLLVAFNLGLKDDVDLVLPVFCREEGRWLLVMDTFDCPAFSEDLKYFRQNYSYRLRRHSLAVFNHVIITD